MARERRPPFWRGHDAVDHCATYHPPGSESLVVEWVAAEPRGPAGIR